MDSFWGNIFRAQSEQRNIVHFLAKIPIFAGLKPKELQALERIVHSRQYKPDEVIFRKDDPGVGMYIIRSGTVRIVLAGSENGQPASKPERNPKEIVLARLGGGDFFGEAALPDGGPRSATAIAEEESSLIGLFRPDLLDFCRRDQETGIKVLWNICEVLAVRLRQTNQELTRVRAVRSP